MCGISGWQRISDYVVIPDGYTQSVEVYPPTGKVFVGGGFVTEGPDVWVTSNRPSAAGDAWAVIAHNSTGGNTTVYVYAVAVNVCTC